MASRGNRLVSARHKSTITVPPIGFPDIVSLRIMGKAIVLESTMLIVAIVLLLATAWGLWNLYAQVQRFSELVGRCEETLAQLQGDQNKLRGVERESPQAEQRPQQ
jgi:small neutral amino acid transporter SnatA (MarC family)